MLRHMHTIFARYQGKTSWDMIAVALYRLNNVIPQVISHQETFGQLQNIRSYNTLPGASRYRTVVTGLSCNNGLPSCLSCLPNAESIICIMAILLMVISVGIGIDMKSS